MGYQTEFMVLNDAADQIKKHPVQFAEAVYSACTDAPFRKERQSRGLNYHPDCVDFAIGNYCNPLIALSSHHADQRRVIISGHNNFANVSRWSESYKNTVKRFPDILEGDIALLEQTLKDLKKLREDVNK